MKVNDSITSDLFYQIYLSLFEPDACTPPKCGELSEYTDSVHTEVEVDEMCVTNAGMTQDNFILPAPPVGLPVSPRTDLTE